MSDHGPPPVAPGPRVYSVPSDWMRAEADEKRRLKAAEELARHLRPPTDR